MKNAIEIRSVRDYEKIERKDIVWRDVIIAALCCGWIALVITMAQVGNTIADRTVRLNELTDKVNHLEGIIYNGCQ